MELLGSRMRHSSPVPILVLTADTAPETKLRALDAGASDFLAKPLDQAEVALRVRNLLRTRRLQLELEHHSEVLEQRVRARTNDLDQSRLEVIERLALAAEFRDDDTQEHAQRVGRTAALLAQQLGLTTAAVEIFRRAAPLHDIGKIGISDTILLKPGKLTAEEFALIKTHPVIGGDILSGSAYMVLQTAEEIALTHHERWDGGGYPHGLAGEKIPLSGRLTGLADVFDALVHERPYKPAWPPEKALAEIRTLSEKQFDPRLVQAFETLDHDALLAAIESSQNASHPPPDSTEHPPTTRMGANSRAAVQPAVLAPTIATS
jgi:putative two-component system response regulator